MGAFDLLGNELSVDRRVPLRGWLAALFLIGAYFAFNPVENAIHIPIAKAWGLHMISHGEMGLQPYGALMIVRLCLEMAIVFCVFAILRRRWPGFPLRSRRMVPLTFIGLLIGLVVMTGAIVVIIVSGNAEATPSMQTAMASTLHGTGWLVFDYLGAAGEELYGRVAVLLVAQSLVGKRGAILVSGLVFAALHLGNPGADWVWLLRLFMQGMLLAYAVYRTGSVWWSIGYHTGWNWASAPLFGAAGSGFLDQGHLFDFKPTGSLWITGGAVGPEGSVYAFSAVLCALGLLIVATPGRRWTDT